MKIKCNKCNGTGLMELSKFQEGILKDRIKGMTVREIAKKHKKGVTTIQYHLTKLIKI